jgi:RecA/RadA recombinase
MKIQDILKVANNEYATIAEDAVCGDVNKWVDSGSYTFNAIVSGSIFKGLPCNKILGLVGVESTGKTFFALAAVKHFLESDPDAVAVYFETEGALTIDQLEGRQIDTKRFAVMPVTTVQEFKNQAIRVVQEKIDKKDTAPVMFILDSLGNLSTTKEMEDSVAGSDTKDMTRAQVLKAAFRVLSLKLSVAKIPMIFTNHVYDKIGQGPYAGKEQGGGCLVTGTQVVMGDMTLRNIEDVMVGEYVLTLNGSKEVLSCWDETNLDDPEPECYRLTFDDGSIVECSDNHRFMVDGNWVEAKDVKVGDYFDVFRG